MIATTISPSFNYSNCVFVLENQCQTPVCVMNLLSLMIIAKCMILKHFLVQPPIKDNLSTKDKMAGPKVSFFGDSTVLNFKFSIS